MAITSFKDLRESTEKIMFERTSGAFTITFLLTWIAWNWKVWYITLFVAESATAEKNRLTEIETYFSDPLNWYLYPLLLSFAVLIIVPSFGLLAYWLQLKFTTAKRKLHESWSNVTPLTLEESNSLRREYLEKHRELSTVFHTKDKEIERLTSLIASYSSKENELKEINFNLKKSNDLLQKEKDESVLKIEQTFADLKTNTDKIQHLQKAHIRSTQLTSALKDTLKFLIQKEISAKNLIKVLPHLEIMDEPKNIRSTLAAQKILDIYTDHSIFKTLFNTKEQKLSSLGKSVLLAYSQVSE